MDHPNFLAWVIAVVIWVWIGVLVLSTDWPAVHRIMTWL